ncbi:hypothetical protein ACJMK2_004925 [Sinanodonta woodiana]|uniref:WAP domain-containing protein n=1 Tax=Sinanodonta woodiana TaxID=1069815 RepID=A0ABD3VPT4_SINWO
MQLTSSLLICMFGAVLIRECPAVPTSTCRRCDRGGVCIDLCPVGQRCQIVQCITTPCPPESCVADNGVCPPVPRDTFGVCAELCSGGGPIRPCPHGQLCCSNGCGHVCKTAIYPGGRY